MTKTNKTAKMTKIAKITNTAKMTKMNKTAKTAKMTKIANGLGRARGGRAAIFTMFLLSDSSINWN